MSRALLFVLLLGGPMLRAQEISIDLSGAWKMQEGDDPAWASSDLDDSGWGTFTLPTSTASVARGKWLRRSFDLPGPAAGQPLVITIGGFVPEYEVFLNGVRLGEAADSSSYVRVRLFDVAPGIARAGPGNVVALRVKRNRPMAGTRSSMQNAGPFLVTGRVNAPALAPALDFERRLRRATPALGAWLVFGVLAILLFVLWLGEPLRVELLALALMLALDATVRYVEYFRLQDNSPGAFLQLYGLPFVLPAIYAIQVLRYRPRPIWWTAAIPAALLLDWLVPRGDATVLIFWVYIAAVIAVLIRRWPELRGRRAVAFSALVLPANQIVRTPSAYRPFLASAELGGFLVRTYDLAEGLLAVGMVVLLVRRLIDDRREKARLGAELEAARTVQQLLVADAVEGAEAVYWPAQEVGGDFHWSRQNPDGSVLVVVGDVSGKGLKAAMLVSAAIGALRATDESEPGAVLARLNTALLASTGGGFVTAAAALVDGARMRIANAGHPSPYCDGEELPVEPGLPLGVVAGMEYPEQEFDAGRQLTFVSDGVVEAANAKGELFGFERTRAISMQTAKEIADAARAWGQTDDITVVTVRRAA